MVGWVSEPDGRGTVTLIWTCFLAIFTCTWSVIHTNLPAEGESSLKVFLRKTRWALWAIYAPELVTAHAATQWQGARKSRSEMRALGLSHWELVHGFFALSGGFILHTGGIDNTPPFPINAKALHYLVDKGYVDAPSITAEEIWDRSKQDKLSKVVALVQSLYVVTQVIGRASQRLAISCLELVTVAFLLCTAATYYFWLWKALDIETHEHIYLKIPMASVLLEAGHLAEKPFIHTPMDFVEQPGWFFWKRHPLLQNFGGISGRPLRRIPNDFYDPPSTLRIALFLWMLSISHLGIHVIGWVFTFPTMIEWYLWQIASLGLLGIFLISGVLNVLSVIPGWGFRVNTLGIWYSTPKDDTFWRKWALNGPSLVGAMLYYVAKTYIILECLLSLRLMPSSVYRTVDWTQYLLRGA
ncbi:hypothetical protein EKO27_g9149 [Xylaria grammica]|uniref:Uncharacterized protein n=1 Tax=Xylaria grammica TaxID=363999 RepID=A0A439CUW6_9PEZI|nr:hypothetical protein EKO27_g9149 [Xylaria grammica]